MFPPHAHYIGGAGAGDAASPAPVFTRSFSSLLGLKKGIFLAGTSTRSPVFRLRPTRGLRCRVRKLPNPRISILSPTRSERTMLSKMVSTITSLSLRVNSASFETSSIRSAFVIASLHSKPVKVDEKISPAQPTTLPSLHNLLKFQGFLARCFSKEPGASLHEGSCTPRTRVLPKTTRRCERIDIIRFSSAGVQVWLVRY